MDFLRLARDRAQDVVAQAQHQLQQQQQKHSGANASTGTASASGPTPSSSSQQLVSPGSRPLGGTGSGGGGSGLPGLSALYTGSLPPLIRSGIASLDPRFESTRQSHLLSNSLKALNIDHEATARESKAAATQVFKWGQDLSPNPKSSSSSGTTASPRLDGSCDPALTDITDRLAFALSTIGDLEAAHVKRAEAARKEFKDIARAETELSGRREKRVKLHKELLNLVPERAKPASAKRIGELEAQLKSLEAEDKAAEEAFGKLRREKFASSISKYMDSYIELGEKLACVARHGKLLAGMVPTDQTPPFPAASLAGASGWEGSAQTAQVRAAIGPALQSLQVNYSVPSLASIAAAPGAMAATTTAAAPASSAASSYAESHAADIAEAERTHAAVVSELSNAPAPSAIGTAAADAAGASTSLHAPPPLHRFDSGSSYGVSPPPTTGASPMAARLNMGPTPHIPASPPVTAAASATDAATTETGGTTTAPAPEAPELPVSPHAPPEDVTVAETGAAIFGTGGPKTGTLGVPRRKSTVPGAATAPPAPATFGGPVPAAGPSTTSASSTSAAFPSAAAASKSAEAAAERLAAEQAEVQATAERERLLAQNRMSMTLGGGGGGGGGAAGVGAAPGPGPAVNARLRRDGTIVRRGEADWLRAEAEDLPPYTPEDSGAGHPGQGSS